MKIYEGIRVDNKGNVTFNWQRDDKNKDILLLDGFEASSFNEDDVQYIYAYNYTQKATAEEKRIVRNYLKDMKNIDEIDDFVDNGVLKLNAVKDIRSFRAFIYIKPRKPLSLISRIQSYLLDYSSPFSVDFHLVKKCYSEVTFDKNKLETILKKKHWSPVNIEDTINNVEYKFQQLKKSGKLFEMKKFIPRQVREAFTDFLKFESKETEEVYRNLQGVDVLAFDDFLTSGSTVKEIIRYLGAINPNNKLTIFILVNQKDTN